MADDRYRAAYDAAMEDVAKAHALLADAQKFANMMASRCGVEPPFANVETPDATTGRLTIAKDQFANFAAPSEAARAFLKMRGQAVELEAILDGLRRGGFTFTTSKPEQANGLAKAMGKDKSVRRLDSGAYGLWEWYPKAKREREKKPGDKASESDGGSSPPAAESESPEPPRADPSEES